MRAVNAASPEVEFAVWDRCERLVPKRADLRRAGGRVSFAFEPRGSAAAESGRILLMAKRARYAEAEPLFTKRSALAICEQPFKIGSFEGRHPPQQPGHVA